MATGTAKHHWSFRQLNFDVVGLADCCRNRQRYLNPYSANYFQGFIYLNMPLYNMNSCSAFITQPYPHGDVYEMFANVCNFPYNTVLF